MTEDGERLTRLETKAEQSEDDRDHIARRLENQEKDIKAIRTDLHEIKLTISKYQGFLGGVMFVVTAFGAVIGALITAFWRKIAG